MNIIELAKEAGFTESKQFEGIWIVDQDEVNAFAALVRAEREWVDLTDDEVFSLGKEKKFPDTDPVYFARVVIAAFKEKNK